MRTIHLGLLLPVAASDIWEWGVQDDGCRMGCWKLIGNISPLDQEVGLEGEVGSC